MTKQREHHNHHQALAGLHPERTALAWRRTGMAMAIAGLSALKVLPEAPRPRALIPAAFGLLAALAVLGLAQLRYRAVQSALNPKADSRATPLPSGWLILLVTILVSSGGIVAIAYTLSLLR